MDRGKLVAVLQLDDEAVSDDKVGLVPADDEAIFVQFQTPCAHLVPPSVAKSKMGLNEIAIVNAGSSHGMKGIEKSPIC